jgi:hypothetical protein
LVELRFWVERPPKVSRFDLKKIRSKNFMIPGEPWLRAGGGRGDRSNEGEIVAGDVEDG